jgi:hypothetical protein
VTSVREDLPDEARVEKLVIEARGLIDEQKETRQSARRMRTERGIDARKQARVERLLLNAMQVVSAQGLAAYPDDAEREVRYRLDHVYGRKPSAAADPGAGGRTGVPDAAGPAGPTTPPVR